MNPVNPMRATLIAWYFPNSPITETCNQSIKMLKLKMFVKLQDKLTGFIREHKVASYRKIGKIAKFYCMKLIFWQARVRFENKVWYLLNGQVFLNSCNKKVATMTSLPNLSFFSSSSSLAYPTLFSSCSSMTLVPNSVVTYFGPFCSKLSRAKLPFLLRLKMVILTDKKREKFKLFTFQHCGGIFNFVLCIGQ